MANKKNWLGMLAVLLTLGLVLASCDNGTGGGGGDASGGGDTSAFIGTWNGTLHGRPMTAVFTASEWEIGDSIESASGTYTVSGATATLMSVRGGGGWWSESTYGYCCSIERYANNIIYFWDI
jgi:hypothetical protein